MAHGKLWLNVYINHSQVYKPSVGTWASHFHDYTWQFAPLSGRVMINKNVEILFIGNFYSAGRGWIRFNSGESDWGTS